MRQASSHLLSALIGCALFAATAAHAQQPAPVEETYSPLAANLWAGIAFDYLHASGGSLSNSESKAGAAFGGDVGFRFSPGFALVALGEYAPIFSSASGSNYYTVGGGIRTGAGMGQLLIGGGYSSLNTDGGSVGGFGVKLLGTYPIWSGFGPYLQLAYHRFSESGASLDLFTANGGLSFSY